MTIKLKPCPFCGSKAGIIHPLGFATIQCASRDCGASIPAQNENNRISTTRWNKRVRKIK